MENVAPESQGGERTDSTVAVLEDGILTGIVGAAVVAIWFLILDTARGQMLITPSLLGIVILLLFLLFESILFTFAAVVFPNLIGAIGAVAVACGNLFAAIAMFWFLIRRRPHAFARLRLAWQED
jgi:hypothetical protein